MAVEAVTGGRWVALDRHDVVLIGRHGTSQARLRRAALDDYGVPAQDLRLEWRPDQKDQT